LAELDVPEAEFRKSVDRRFRGVNARIYLVAGLTVAVLLGGLMLLWSELRDLKGRLENVKADAGAIKEQLANLQSRLRWLDETLEKNSAEAVRAIREAAAPANAPDQIPFVAMTLSANEREVIRKFFNLRKQPDSPGFDAKVGDIASQRTPLYPVPDDLSETVPKLKGYRFFPDQAAGTIVIVRSPDNRVVAII
jgi:uncharacterized protein YdhG (YjbR/CyaY superfamily)